MKRVGRALRWFYRGVAAALRHRRIVQSGSPPLYWQMLLGAIISGVSQIIAGAPESVNRSSGEAATVDYMFCGFQLVGAVISLASLYVEDGSARHAERLYWSLAFEGFGLVLLFTASAVYVGAVTVNNGHPPTSMATWYVIMFSVWSMRTRMPQIWNGLQELKG
ncbi:membrane protein [Gordonia phage Mariokart]|nr:membrane protein [Gordonia phage Mariokart]